MPFMEVLGDSFRYHEGTTILSMIVPSGIIHISAIMKR